MIMKVHNKGQVVIPVHLRKLLGIDVGDLLEVEVVPEEGKIELRVSAASRAKALAGSLRAYGQDKAFPSDREIAEALKRGLLRGG